MGLTEQIAAIRKQRKLTQGELARLSGTSQANISRIEKGVYNPTLSLLMRIAEALKAEIRIEAK